MEQKVSRFTKKCEHRILEENAKYNYQITLKEKDDIELRIHIGDLKVCIMYNEVSFIGEYIYRIFELRDYLVYDKPIEECEDELIEEFIKKLFFYLKPENYIYRDRPSLKSWRSTLRWFLAGLGYIGNYDVPPKN